MLYVLELFRALFRWLRFHALRLLGFENDPRPAWTVSKDQKHTKHAGVFFVSDPTWRSPLTIRGLIVEWPGLSTDVYLFDPPAFLRQHPHGRCLQLLRPEEKWFLLHWTKPARTFEESRDFVEQMMWESVNLKTRS